MGKEDVGKFGLNTPIDFQASAKAEEVARPSSPPAWRLLRPCSSFHHTAPSCRRNLSVPLLVCTKHACSITDEAARTLARGHARESEINHSKPQSCPHSTERMRSHVIRFGLYASADGCVWAGPRRSSREERRTGVRGRPGEGARCQTSRLMQGREPNTDIYKERIRR
eukprot:548444-Rhodomonas_salina.1